MCPYRLITGTSPTPLRKLSKGPTVLAHRVENPPESGARKAEKCQKNPGKNVALCLFCASCIYMPFRTPPMHPPSDFMRNRKNYVKVTGLSCIPFGTFLQALGHYVTELNGVMVDYGGNWQ
jgi:hypothetical protein